VTEKKDSGRLKTVTRIFVFDDPDGSIAKQLQNGASIERFIDKLRATHTIEGNVFLNEGITFIWQAVTGASGLTYFDGSHAYIGVGDGTAVEDPSQTGLQGTNKYYKLVDSGYPKVSGNVVKFRATFGPEEGNFPWKEWSVANGNSDAAVNLNRKVQDLGTKASDTTWSIEVQLQIT
jgi:hypothetical protein